MRVFQPTCVEPRWVFYFGEEKNEDGREDEMVLKIYCKRNSWIFQIHEAVGFIPAHERIFV